MQLKDDIRRAVAFIGWQGEGPVDKAPIVPSGTCFFINGGEAFPEAAFIVTARHVAEKLHPPFVIRLNKKGGGAGLIHIERPSDIEWCFHDDATVDVAVAPFRAPSWANVRGFNAPGLLEDARNLDEIDAGSQVCVVGLFHFVYGKRENLPITHVGHVAMLPKDEMISVDGVHREGYLVQANAISGCSGSPVVAVRQVRLDVKPRAIIGMEDTCMLLGVWSSSWKVKGSDIVSIKTDDDDSRGTLAPLGLGFVTPLPKLIEVLWGDAVKQASARLLAKLHNDRSPTPDNPPIRSI